MKRMVKKVLLVTAAVLCCTAVIVGGVWCSVQRDTSSCTQVRIVVKDSVKSQFVDARELESYLKRKQCYPQGKTMDVIDSHAIEQYLCEHEMVRTAQCYKSPFGRVNIVVTQRVPMLGVTSSNGCYYVDSDRRVMPIRGEMISHIPVFKGAVSERAATEEYFDFALWLKDHNYWSPRIDHIHVHNPKYIVLSQVDMKAKIIMGSLNDYEKKLKKLHTLYTKGLDKMGYPEYKEYDLRFTNQVVARN